jgi:hypothetical protein
VLYQPQRAGARLRDRSFLTSDRTVIAAAFFVGPKANWPAYLAQQRYLILHLCKKVAKIVLAFPDVRPR